MARNRIIALIGGALASLAIFAAPAASAEMHGRKALPPSALAAELTARGHYPFGAHGFDSLLGWPEAAAEGAPLRNRLALTVAPTDPAQIAALVREHAALKDR